MVFVLFTAADTCSVVTSSGTAAPAHVVFVLQHSFSHAAIGPTVAGVFGAVLWCSKHCVCAENENGAFVTAHVGMLCVGICCLIRTLEHVYCCNTEGTAPVM
jgi:hypothetical protein